MIWWNYEQIGLTLLIKAQLKQILSIIEERLFNDIFQETRYYSVDYGETSKLQKTSCLKS